jgi:DNA-directed RNA polymerase subunit F
LLEQQAVIAFAERSDKLSQDRQRELANNLSGYLGCKDEEAVLKIKSIAANLLGKA